MTITVNEKTRELFPPRVRRQAGLKLGDELEVKVSGGVITLLRKPSMVVTEPPQKGRKRLLAKFTSALEELRTDAEQTGVDKKTLRQIDAEVAAARKERRKTVSAAPGK